MPHHIHETMLTAPGKKQMVGVVDIRSHQRAGDKSHQMQRGVSR